MGSNGRQLVSPHLIRQSLKSAAVNSLQIKAQNKTINKTIFGFCASNEYYIVAIR